MEAVIEQAYIESDELTLAGLHIMFFWQGERVNNSLLWRLISHKMDILIMVIKSISESAISLSMCQKLVHDWK